MLMENLMKRLALLVATSLIAFVLTGCGEPVNKKETTVTTETTETTKPETAAEEKAVEHTPTQAETEGASSQE